MIKISKKYVGIDASTKTGLVIQDENGIIHQDEVVYRYQKDPERMIFIVDKVLSMLNKDCIIGIEGFSYNSQGASHDYQYGIGYIMRENLMRNNIPYYEITPTQLKKFACGYGKAKKETLVEPIKKRWGFYHPSDNTTDAFVLSEIVKAIDLGNDYGGLREHEKQVVFAVKNGSLNMDKWKETDPPSWKKKIFNEQKRKDRQEVEQIIKDIKLEIREAKKDKTYGDRKENLNSCLQSAQNKLQEIKDRKIILDWE